MRKFLSFALCFFAGAVLFFCCQSPAEKKQTSDTDSTNPGNAAAPGTSQWDFSGITATPYLPTELNYPSTETDQVVFAWNEFLALNWKSSWDTDRLRDKPDYNWNYSYRGEPYPPLVRWETFAHRTELRPANNVMLPFDAAPHYSFGDKFITPVNSGDQFNLFDNLDENNEIGSCDVYGQVGSTLKNDIMVLYQAKANREEYEYVRKNFPTKEALKRVTNNTHNNIINDSAYYPGATSACDIPAAKNVLCLPCGVAGAPGSGAAEGAVEVKTAWRQLRPEEDATTFFVRQVIVYVTSPDGKNVSYTNKNYALIGLHIIHKTHNYPNFIFATFEHVNVEKQDMAYAELGGPDQGKLVRDYPRLHPIPAIVDSSTAYVHRLLAGKNKASIWQNYRLVGVQTRPTDDTAAFNFFMANYVIESDPALASFHGSGLGTPFDMGKNILFDRKFYSMGGCQGCHGVAQIQLGGDGSFLMDDIGKPVDTPDIGIHDKLQKYLKAFQKIKIRDQEMLSHKH